ncbi:MAG: DsbA family oxidoreductase [Vulcanimicrobiaceae bacterium]
MQVDLWTDVACPWCYIGVARFDRALAQTGFDITLRVHPYQLDPEAPIPGVPAIERYRRKFGNEAQAIVERVTSTARADGLDFDLTRAVTANTFDAHRAIQYAQRIGRARELERSLYRAYFADGLDVSDREILAQRAASVGIERDEIAAYLRSDDGVDAVRRELMQAVETGINGVPSFLFNGEFMVPGAVDEQSFERILRQMHAMPEETA